MRRVLLLGMGPTGPSALESLAEQFDVAGVVRDVQENTEAADPVACRARELSIPVLSDTAPGAVLQAVEEFRPHCTVVSSYNRILGAQLLERGKFVNVHYALLPKYRGRANVNWAILNGETATAITIHSIVPGLDAGNILFQKSVPIGPDQTATELYDVLNQIQRKELGNTIARYIDGFTGVAQDESESTYGCARIPADGEIDWSCPTDHVYALIRALAPPYPGAFSYLETLRLTIHRALPVPDGHHYTGRIPGRVVARSKVEGSVDVLTGDGILRILEVAVGDNERPVPASAVITSTRQTLGLRSADLLKRIEDLEARLAELIS